jgi:hypothetical protein
MTEGKIMWNIQKEMMDYARAPEGETLPVIVRILRASQDRNIRKRRWDAEQRPKAPVVANLLQRHLPSAVLEDLRQFMSTPFGCVYLGDMLHGRPPGESYDGLPFEDDDHASRALEGDRRPPNESA